MSCYTQRLLRKSDFSLYSQRFFWFCCMAKHFLSVFLISLLIQFSSGLEGSFCLLKSVNSSENTGEILAKSIDDPGPQNFLKLNNSSKDHVEREAEKNISILQPAKIFLRTLFGQFWINSNLLQFLDENSNRLYLILCAFLN